VTGYRFQGAGDGDRMPFVHVSLRFAGKIEGNIHERPFVWLLEVSSVEG